MTMIETVARAIYYGTARNRPWEKLTSKSRRYWEKRAAAAIAAMREPTEVMTNKVAHANWTTDGVKTWADGWRMMIDAALDDTPSDERDGEFRGVGRDEFGDPVDILKPGDSR